MRLPRAFLVISSTCCFWVRVINLIADTTHSVADDIGVRSTPQPETADRPWHMRLEPADYPSPSTIREVPSRGNALWWAFSLDARIHLHRAPRPGRNRNARLQCSISSRYPRLQGPSPSLRPYSCQSASRPSDRLSFAQNRDCHTASGWACIVGPLARRGGVGPTPFVRLSPDFPQ